jgi:hypothetical protein
MPYCGCILNPVQAVGRSVSWLVSQLAGLPVGRSVGQSVSWLVGLNKGSRAIGVSLQKDKI